MSDFIEFTGNPLSLDQLQLLYRGKAGLKLAALCYEQAAKAEAIVTAAATGADAVYGVNTGFGKLASKRISPEETSTLQRNLILSHCAGVGEAVPEHIVRLMMVLKLTSLARGASGVSAGLLSLLEEMLSDGVVPVVPGQGSVGASGDLAPLAHITAVMIGEGEAFYDGERLPGREALHRAGLAPITLGAKEGLAMINGTQFSTAYALAGLFETFDLFNAALMTGAMATDAAMGSDAPFRAEIHILRGHKSQCDAAKALRHWLSGSEIRRAHLQDDDRVQDPYCLRCQPQVMGACLDLLRQAARVLQIEANAVTDNPLVLTATGEIISGGNFHAEPVAFAADQIALAIAEIGAITQRRIAMLVDPVMNFGLPAFLTPEPGLNSGFMIAEVTSAALMSENKQRATPCSIDSTPTSANQEDHVSMAAHGARRLMPMSDNLRHIIAIEWLCAAQGIWLRAPLTTSDGLQKSITILQVSVPPLEEDRFIASDIEAASALLRQGDWLEISLDEHRLAIGDQ